MQVAVNLTHEAQMWEGTAGFTCKAMKYDMMIPTLRRLMLFSAIRRSMDEIVTDGVEEEFGSFSIMDNLSRGQVGRCLGGLCSFDLNPRNT